MAHAATLPILTAENGLTRYLDKGEQDGVKHLL